MTPKNVSSYYADENVARLIALQVIVIMLLVFLNNRTYLIFILALDFALRGFSYWPSPLAFVAKLVLKLLKVQPKPVFAAPKKFAAAVGFVFAAAISVLLLLDFDKTPYVLGGILIWFAFLEAAFKICVGCYVYNWLVAPIVNKINNKQQQAIKND